MKNKNFFVNNTFEDLVSNIAELYADLNVIHPFRDGNGRAQRILFEHITLNCEYVIDWSVVTINEWVLANIQGVGCDFSSLKNIFKRALSRAN